MADLAGKNDTRIYTDSIVKGKTHWWQIEYRKVKWTMWKSENVRTVERLVRGHLEAFQLCLGAIKL